MARLSFFGRQVPLRAPAAPSGVAASSSSPDLLAGEPLLPVSTVKPARSLTPACAEAVDDDGAFDFIVSITGRTRRRCLHAAGGCYRARALTFVQYEVYSGRVDPSSYTAVCRTCWKGSSAEMLADEAPQASEDSSSSSSSDAA